MSMTKQKYKNDCIIFDTLENLVPQDHLVRKIERCMDFTFIEYEVKDLYISHGAKENGFYGLKYTCY